MRLLVLCLMLVLVSCSGNSRQTPQFDGERAFTFLTRQVEFGPRVPGSPASAACRDWFLSYFDSLGLKVDTQSFEYFDPYSRQKITMVNVITTGGAELSPAVVLMAHYDSRPRAEHARDTSLREVPIDGANDGASGVAVLMELAALIAQDPPACRVDLVLVDGEDWGKPGDLDNYLLGSKEFASRGIRDKYQIGVVIDLIGDADQQIYREGYSDGFTKELNDVIWAIARRLDIPTFIDSIKYTVHDDHLSLNVGGVPAVVLIDFDFPHWHTEFDTPDKCSPQSLANVGRVLVELMYHPDQWPTF